MSEHSESGVPRCQHVSPSPWGPTQCALPDGHEGRHAYSPSEHVEETEMSDIAREGDRR